MHRYPTPAWETLIADFVAHERGVIGLAAPTLRHRDLHLRTFAAWWDEQRPGEDARAAITADLSAFLIAETDRGMSAATRRAQIVVLRRFYSWLVLTGAATSDPTVHVRGPRSDATEIAVYRPTEVDTILSHTAALDDLRGRLRHTIVATLRFTGMRSGELRTLRRDRLDLDAGTARVIGKGSRPRVVVLPPPVQQILERFLDEVRPELPESPLLLSNPARLVTTPHRGFGPEAVHREVALAGERAGVPGRHFPHRWRHTFATELVRAGVDIHVVQRLLGHRTVTSTVGYTHLAVDDLVRALTSYDWQ